MGYCGAPTIPLLQETGKFINKNAEAMEEKLVTLAILTYSKAQILKNAH